MTSIKETADKAAADADYRYMFTVTSAERAQVDRAQYVGRAVAVAVLRETLRKLNENHAEPEREVVRRLLAECAPAPVVETPGTLRLSEGGGATWERTLAAPVTPEPPRQTTTEKTMKKPSTCKKPIVYTPGQFGPTTNGFVEIAGSADVVSPEPPRQTTKDGGTSLTEGASVSGSAPTQELPHDVAYTWPDAVRLLLKKIETLIVDNTKLLTERQLRQPVVTNWILIAAEIRLLIAIADGNPAATQSSGDHRGSASAEKHSLNLSPSPSAIEAAIDALIDAVRAEARREAFVAGFDAGADWSTGREQDCGDRPLPPDAPEAFAAYRARQG